MDVFLFFASSHMFGFPLLRLLCITEHLRITLLKWRVVFGLFHLEFVSIKSWDLYTFKKNEHLSIKFLKLSKKLETRYLYNTHETEIAHAKWMNGVEKQTRQINNGSHVQK